MKKTIFLLLSSLPIMPMCINIHNRRCISHTSVKKKGTTIRPSIDLETESISVDKYTKHNIIRKGNNNMSNIYKHVISSDEYKESWTRSVGREYIRDKVWNNCVVFALFGPPRGRFVTTIHEYTILFTRRLELNACEELKRGPRGGDNVDVMQCNWPCEVNVLTDDSRHTAQPMHRYRTKSCFRGLRSLCKRRIKLRPSIDVTANTLVNCERFLFYPCCRFD